VVTAQNVGCESAGSNQASATSTASGAHCKVTYSVTTQSGSDLSAAITIQNTGTKPVDTWSLTWTWGGNQQITDSSNSNYSQTGKNATLTNVSSNGSIAPGATISGIGFNASYSGSNAAPSSFHLNGVNCQ